MFLATYLDGNEKTTLGVLKTRHSVVSYLKVPGELMETFREWILNSYDIPEVEWASDLSKPCPVVLSADALIDIGEDMSQEPEPLGSFGKSLIQMCDSDSHMGLVYFLKSKP